MRKLTLLALLGAFVLVPVCASALTINEIRIDNAGGDTDEYFELAGNPGESLDGYFYVVIGDGTGAGAGGYVESVVDLAGLAIQADGFLAVHKDGTTAQCSGYDVEATMSFENSDNVTHMLVDGFTGAIGDDADVDDDNVFDYAGWASIVDSVSLIESVGSGDLYYGINEVGPDGTYVPAHALVCDGVWQIGDFDVCLYDTPGEANSTCAVGNEDLTFGEIKALYR